MAYFTLREQVAYVDHVRAFLEAQAQCGVPGAFASSNVSILNLFYYTLMKILLKPVATSFSKETLLTGYSDSKFSVV